MIIDFDSLGMFEKPNVQICNPNGDPLKSVGKIIFDSSVVLRFNSMSEFNFSIPQKIETDVYIEAYDEVVSKRLVKVENLGMFLITSVNIIDDGVRNVKQVKCFSIEAELNYKKINLFSGTYKFYDPVSPQNTLVGKIFSYLPSWTIGEIDSELWNKYRTFDISDQTIYAFLMTTIEQAYECVFTFDSFTKTVNAYATKNAVTDTSISLSYDNLVKELQVEEMSDELITALYSYGNGDLDVRTVNPLGNSVLYNFDYFLYGGKEWFSDSLKNAVIAWNSKVETLQPQYANLLSQFRTNNALLITQNGELTTLKSEFSAIEAVMKARIEGGLPYDDIYTQLNAKQLQIETKEAQIKTTQNTVTSISNQLTNINTQLSFINNFTTEQYKELSNYIIENTYQNEAFVQTDNMTTVQIQDMAQELYDQSKNVLTKLSQPRFTFSVDSVNFLFLQEFKEFTKQLKMGCQINVAINDKISSYPVLLEMEFSFDDPTNFKMTFGNRLRLDKNDFVFSELFGDSVSAGTTVSFSQGKWNEFNRDYKDDVSEFINSALDCAKNNVINAQNQEIIIDSNGLKGQRYVPTTDTYSPEKVWLTSNTLAFTKNNWQTASLAIGKVGEGIFGVVGDVIVGRILAGNQLQITNSNNNFVLDANGCVLNNASFTMTTNNQRGKIILDANQGIKIQGNTGSGFVDKFFVDTSGNVNFTGKLNGATGSFSGELTSATFKSGSININNKFIVDALGNCKATSIEITGGSFKSGTIEGSNLIGGSLNIGNGRFTVDSYGRCTASDINIIGGSINIATDITVGNKIVMRGDIASGGIEFRDRYGYLVTYIQGYSNGGIGMQGAVVASESFSAPYMFMNNELVATQRWVSANVKIPNRTQSTYAGSHNHGIADGTKIQTDDGYVTWRSYDGFSHRHDI